MLETTEITETTETAEARCERLNIRFAELSDGRRESMEMAHAAGVTDAGFLALATSLRLSRNDTIRLPASRFEGLSRGRGWCRSGHGADARWGEREDGWYRVGPGRWTIYGTDGFSRENRETWNVRHVDVGTETWTIAN
jgi:hypothetical protein